MYCFSNSKYTGCGGNTRNAVILIKMIWCTCPHCVFDPNVSNLVIFLLYLFTVDPTYKH